jgi:hypothetical protein
MTKLITADFYRRNAETVINSRKSIATGTKSIGQKSRENSFRKKSDNAF